MIVADRVKVKDTHRFFRELALKLKLKVRHPDHGTIEEIEGGVVYVRFDCPKKGLGMGDRVPFLVSEVETI